MPSQVLGSGPVGFTDSDGNQRFIPLSALYFDDKGIQVDETLPLYNNNKAIVDSLLERLVAGGFLTPAPNEPPKPAMILKSAVPGAKGNYIQVTFNNIVEDSVNPNNTMFDAIITAKDTYTGLSFNPTSPLFIKKVLGTETITGTSPGLVHIKDADTLSQPEDNQSYTLENGGDSTKSFKAVNNASSGTAFTVEAWKDGSDGNNITVKISDVDATAETFTLVVEWKQPPVHKITLAQLPKTLTGNSFVIEVSPPKDAVDAKFAIPAPGTITLSGGADAQAASTASATVFSK